MNEEEIRKLVEKVVSGALSNVAEMLDGAVVHGRFDGKPDVEEALTFVADTLARVAVQMEEG